MDIEPSPLKALTLGDFLEGRFEISWKLSHLAPETDLLGCFWTKPSKSKIWTRRTGYLLRKPPGTCLEICRCKGQSKLSEMEWHGLYMFVVKTKNFNHYNTIEYMCSNVLTMGFDNKKEWIQAERIQDWLLVYALVTFASLGFKSPTRCLHLFYLGRKWREHLSSIHNYTYNLYLIICVYYISYRYLISM